MRPSGVIQIAELVPGYLGGGTQRYLNADHARNICLHTRVGNPQILVEHTQGIGVSARGKNILSVVWSTPYEIWFWIGRGSVSPWSRPPIWSFSQVVAVPGIRVPASAERAVFSERPQSTRWKTLNVNSTHLLLVLLTNLLIQCELLTTILLIQNAF